MNSSAGEGMLASKEGNKAKNIHYIQVGRLDERSASKNQSLKVASVSASYIMIYYWFNHNNILVDWSK